MLRITPAPPNSYPRLRLQGVRATAWIEHRSWHLRGVDWQLWIERGGRITSAKCPLRLEIESLLRSWLLQVSGMPLYTLMYTELRLITEGKIAEAKRLHVRGHDTLMHRLEGLTVGEAGKPSATAAPGSLGPTPTRRSPVVRRRPP
jgi:hypothetical protein